MRSWGYVLDYVDVKKEIVKKKLEKRKLKLSVPMYKKFVQLETKRLDKEIASLRQKI